MKPETSTSLARIQQLFKQLKSDILADSFAYLPRKDLAQLELVNQKFHRIVQSNCSPRHVFTLMALTFPSPSIYHDPTQQVVPRIELCRHKDGTRIADATFTYAEFIELAGGSSLSFAHIHVTSVAIHYSAVNSDAWRALKLTKEAFDGCALKFAYKRSDFPNQTTMVKYLDYVLLPFFDECRSLTLIGPHFPAGQSGDLPLLKCSSILELSTLALYLGVEENDCGTLRRLHENTPTVTADEIVEWLEGWKVPVGTDWSLVEEKCLYIHDETYVGRPEELAIKLRQSFAAASGHRARYRLIVRPVESPNLQPIEWTNENELTGETLRLATMDTTPTIELYGTDHSIVTRGPSTTLALP